LGVMPGLRLAEMGRLAIAEGDLQGAIAVGLHRAKLRDAVRQCFDDGHRDGLAGVVEDARHTRLATDQTQGLGSAHRMSSCSLRPRAAIGPRPRKNLGGLEIPKERSTGLGRPVTPLERYPVRAR